MAPVRSYTNWNSRTTDEEEQIEPYRKYFFICEGANTETWYFKKLIDIRKELNIHPLIDIRLLEKTEGDRDISFPRRLIEFAENQKENPEIAFDKERDKMIVVFDGDIFEEKVLDYDELVAEGEKNNILAVSNPAFELFLEKDEDQRRNLHLTRAPRSDFPEGRMRLHFSIRHGDPRHLHQRERYPLGGVQTSGQSA